MLRSSRAGSKVIVFLADARLEGPELLVEHRVGVQTVDLYRLDEDFFDEL